MPEVVSSWIDDHDIEDIKGLLKSITGSYEADFLKYACPGFFKTKPYGVQFRFNYISHIKKGLISHDLEYDCYLMISVGIIVKVSKIEEPAGPLSNPTDISDFKIYLCDTWLLKSLSAFPASGVSSKTPIVSDML